MIVENNCFYITPGSLGAAGKATITETPFLEEANMRRLTMSQRCTALIKAHGHRHELLIRQCSKTPSPTGYHIYARVRIQDKERIPVKILLELFC